MQGGMDPADEAQPPVGSIQADEARADLIQPHGPLQQRTCKGSIRGVGGREKKEGRQARAATEQRMHAIATQEGAGMLSGSMTKGRIRVSASPSQDGSAIDNQIAGPNESTPQCAEDTEHKERLGQRGSSSLSTLPLLRGARDARLTILSQWQSTCQG